MLSAEAIRAKAIESAFAPQRFDPVATLIDVATEPEDARAGRRAIRQFMREYTTMVRRLLRDDIIKLREEGKYE